MDVECSACHLDANFLSQGSGTPILYLTRCGHICCDMCRTNWFANGKETCPKCRQPQTRSTLIRIYYDVAQRAQPSTSPTMWLSEGPENDLRISSESFLEVVADQATDVLYACVTLLSNSAPLSEDLTFDDSRTRHFLQKIAAQILPSHFSVSTRRTLPTQVPLIIKKTQRILNLFSFALQRIENVCKAPTASFVPF